MSLDFPSVPSADWPKAINQCCLTLFSLSTHRGPIPGGGDWLHYSIWRNPMSQNPNPFVRGYWNLKIVRRSEEHTSELQSLMRISYAVFCLKKKKIKQTDKTLLIKEQNITTIRSKLNKHI